MRNPLIQLGFEIPFDEIEATHVEPAVDALLAKSQAAVDAIVANDKPRTYANTLGALEEATEMLERAMTVVGHLESVATNDELRAAYNAAHPKVSAFWCAASHREAVLGQDAGRLSTARRGAQRTGQGEVANDRGRPHEADDGVLSKRVG